MKLTAPQFEDNGSIPDKFSYGEGNGTNPELRISGAPDGTKSFTLVINDIDAPGGSFIHWIVFDIPASTAVIEQNSIPGLQGTNDADRTDYYGPHPPSGTHRYVFTLYALDYMLSLKEGSDKSNILHAMRGHILGQTHLTGKYGRKAPAVPYSG